MWSRDFKQAAYIHLFRMTAFYFRFRETSPKSKRIVFSSQLQFSDFTDEADSDKRSTLSVCLPPHH